MAVEKRRRATYQDVIDAPEYKVAELIDGELIVSPRPGEPHTIIASMLGPVLAGTFGQGIGSRGGWLILDEPELRFSNGVDTDVLVPDIAAWRVDRLDARGGYRDVTPDWICEVLSKSTRQVDRMKKLPIYARGGVEYAWLVHPGFRTLEVFRATNRQWGEAVIHRGDVVVRAEPFDAVELDLSVLWNQIPKPDRASEGEFEFEYDGTSL